MKTRKGLSLIELIIVIVIIVVLLSILLPPREMRQKAYKRIICGTNLKGLGAAMSVYANEYDGNFPQLPGAGSWSKDLGFAYDLKEPDFKPGGPQSSAGRTITASWYLLVRLEDISPKSFVCPESDAEEFDVKNPQNRDITELWDFGTNPYKHVSYSMHNPYGKYSANQKFSAGFALAADMSPWFKNGDAIAPGANKQPPQIITLTDGATWKLGNSLNHIIKKSIAAGQNVTYADGHTAFEPQSNVGVNKDNIYTFHSTDQNPTEQDIQGGTNPTGRIPENDAKSKDDSFLAI